MDNKTITAEFYYVNGREFADAYDAVNEALATGESMYNAEGVEVFNPKTDEI